MDEKRLFAVKEEMEKSRSAQASALLHPLLLHAGIPDARGRTARARAGTVRNHHVPAIIRERDRQLAGRDRRNLDPVLRRYERVCFEKQYVRLLDRVGAPMASLIHPAHPLDAGGYRSRSGADPQQAKARRSVGRPQRYGTRSQGDVPHRSFGKGGRGLWACGFAPDAVRRNRSTRKTANAGWAPISIFS